MFDFENKSVKDWTLAEAKEYCMSHIHEKHYCLGKNCILNNAESCIGLFCNMELKDNTAQKFTPDEVAFCRLIKKTHHWANYIARSLCSLTYMERQPVFTSSGYLDTRTAGYRTEIDSNFLPQIKPLTYYVIDDIIEQGEKNID